MHQMQNEMFTVLKDFIMIVELKREDRLVKNVA